MTLPISEQGHQIAFVDYLTKASKDGVWWCSIPNEGSRNRVEQGVLMRAGLQKGAPDLLILYQGVIHFIEMKRPGGRKPGKDQRDVHEAIRRAGGRIATCFGIDEAMAQARAWGLVRG